jgi:hypothetical protein
MGGMIGGGGVGWGIGKIKRNQSEVHGSFFEVNV